MLSDERMYKSMDFLVEGFKSYFGREECEEDLKSTDIKKAEADDRL